jgi:outer membrane murein-binding lipoprotein Lpp
MKQVVFYALAAGLVLSAGCSKKEEKPSVPAVSAEKTALPTTMAQVTGKVAAVTAQAQAATKEVAQKVEAVKSALTVKPDQVMAELNQPIADIKTKVASLGQPELLAYANTYKTVLLEKKDQLASLTSSLKGLPMADMLGEKGIALKNQVSQYTSQLAGLKERYSVYLDKLKALGVNLSSFGL